MSEPKKIAKGEMLFYEGSQSDCMYVIKKGCIAVTKKKGLKDDIILAELRDGQLLGEMGFFDRRARSAGARAIEDSEVIALPYNAMKEQYDKFPSWAKVMIKTINNHLRAANQRIKILESERQVSKEMFPPREILKYTAVLSLVSHRAGVQTDDGIYLPTLSLRRYIGNVFGLSNAKLQTLVDKLAGLGILEVVTSDGEQQKVMLYEQDLITRFAEWYGAYLKEPEDERLVLREKEHEMLAILIANSAKYATDAEDKVNMPMNQIVGSSLQEFQFSLTVNHIDLLESKGVIDNKITDTRLIVFDPKELKFVYHCWQIIFALTGIPKDSYK